MVTVRALTEAASMMPVTVITGSETRPSTAARVLWIGGTVRPIHMADGDVWWRAGSSSPTAPSFLTTILNTITNGVAFSQALIMNGTPPFTFAVASGSLPAGLSLNTTTGNISGTPSAAGAYSFVVSATNTVGSITQSYSGTVTSGAISPTISTTALNSLTQGTSFTQTLAVVGTTPITWTVSAGSMPAGLTLNSSNGTISGTPTGSGAYSFAVTATNTAGSDSKTLSGTIASSGAAPVITTSSLNSLTQSTAFSQTLVATGSTPITWGVSSGTLPGGLAINSSSGVISGTPTTAGSYSFTVTATNAFGSDPQAYSGTIAAASATNYSVFNNTTPFSLTSYSDAATGSWVSHQYYSTASPALPAGSKIIGARIYVPTGSAHIGQFWYGACIRNTTAGYYPGVGALPHTQYDSNGSKKLGSALVAGWNQVIFDTPLDPVPGASGSWTIGVQIGDGTRYLADSTFNVGSVQNPEGKNFYLSEKGSNPARSFYNNTVTTANSYGIDVLMSIP